MPDAYLDGLGTGTAVLAAELCSAGVWERTDGGYRILDRAGEAGEAGRNVQAFRPALRYDQVATAGFYDDAGFCQDCDAPYSYRHWHVSQTGYWHCPLGHGKSLDPHW